YLLLFRRDTKLALNNDADEVRLLAPDGTLRDRFAYLHTRPDVSFARTVDGVGGWTDAYPPSPGQPNQPPTPTPTPSPVPKTVFLNEILPAPRHQDWDGDGVKTAEDEWVELINLGEAAVDLGGWMLDDVPDGGSRPYVFPAGSIVPTGGYRLVFRRESKIALNNDADQVRLLSPDGHELDRFEWSRSPGYDRALGRQPDGIGEWTSGLAPSPGGPNPPQTTPQSRRAPEDPTPRPQPRDPRTTAPQARAAPTATTPLPPLLTIAQARHQPDGQEVRVRGQVTVPPEVFGRSIYIQDPSGGIQVYMGRGEWPTLREGDWVEVRGRLADFYGEREVRISSPSQVQVIGPGLPLAPILLRSDELGEPYEGMLVMIVGQVSGFGRRELRLSDHYGEVRVYIREAVGWRRPWVERGDWWSAIGVVSQYAIERPYVGGYRLLPRYRDDLASLPTYLPEIGLPFTSGR
ncbi:MAG: lamin tail domain-containing protein, partial [Anaerolineae bacterium]|nr:lamin tail domain-containing protein [Anaerolineae bacterium]